MSLLRTILILIVFYYVFQIITKYILPALFGRPDGQDKNEFSRNRRNERKKAARHEGEVTIESKSASGRGNNSGKGDYVDYEEVKD